MKEPVLICRPGERGEVLAEALRAEGAWVEPLEVMTLQALDEDATLRSVWLDLDQYHKIVVISPFAARCLAEAIDCYWPQLPVGIAFYSPGRGTAEVLHDALGARVHVPPASAGEDTSEALLSLPSLQRLTHQRVLLVAGEGGRPLLADTLTARGAALTRLAVYRRVYQPPSAELQRRLASGSFHTLIVTSGELLEYLAKWCQQAALDQPLIVSSHRLATLAGKLGFSDLKVASGASKAALVAALNESCTPRDADVDQRT
ncbi:uroporphyrinogen-III synthase [Vreelandella sp. EE27]